MTKPKEDYFFIIVFILLVISTALNLIQSNKIDQLAHETIQLQHEQKAMESYMNELHGIEQGVSKDLEAE